MTVRHAASMPASLSSWEARGYHGSGNVQPLLGSLAGRAVIVCGNASGVFAQLALARQLVADPVIMAVNDVGQYVCNGANDPPLDHWVSLHTDAFAAWKTVRWLHCKNGGQTVYHGVDPKPFTDYAWSQLTPCFALSGYFAMQLAWIMGAAQIVLCGCPGEAQPRFFEAEARADFAYGGGPAGREDGIAKQVIKEMSRLPEFKQAVRSLSGGFTERYFGRV